MDTSGQTAFALLCLQFLNNVIIIKTKVSHPSGLCSL